MFYAKFVSSKYDTPTVYNNTNRPENFAVCAFETEIERDAEINAAWERGGNGFKCTVQDVVRYFGFGFVVGEAQADNNNRCSVRTKTAPIPDYCLQHAGI